MKNLYKLSALTLAFPALLAGNLFADAIAANAQEPEDAAPPAAAAPVAADAVTATRPKTNVRLLNGATFDAFIQQGVVVVEFFTNKITVQNTPFLDNLEAELGERVSFCRINISENKEKIAEYKLGNVPAYIIFKDGVARTMFIGSRPKESFKQAILDLKPASTPKSNVFLLTEDTIDSVIKSGVVLVEFYTNKTNKNLNLLEEVGKEVRGSAIVTRVNLSKSKSLTKKFGIKNVPTYIVFKNGTAMSTAVGTRTKSFLLESIQSITE